MDYKIDSKKKIEYRTREEKSSTIVEGGNDWGDKTSSTYLALLYTSYDGE